MNSGKGLLQKSRMVRLRTTALRSDKRLPSKYWITGKMMVQVLHKDHTRRELALVIGSQLSAMVKQQIILPILHQQYCPSGV
jgi:hypothetical protein